MTVSERWAAEAQAAAHRLADQCPIPESGQYRHGAGCTYTPPDPAVLAVHYAELVARLAPIVEGLCARVEAATREANAAVLAAAEAAIRETGHVLPCTGCTCGASDRFKDKRAEFYRQWRALRA